MKSESISPGFRKTLLCVLLSVLMGAVLVGASPLAQAQNLTLRRAVELALAHSSVMAGAAADQMRAFESYREARNAYMPQLTVGSGLAYAYGFPLSLEGSAPTIFNVNSQSMLLNPAQREFIRAARQEWQASTSQRREQRNQVLLDTALSYAELNKWERQLQTLRDQQDVAQRMDYAVAQRIKEGVDSRLEQTKAKLATAQVRLRTAQAEGSVDVLRTHLSQLTGMPAKSITTITESIPPLAQADPPQDEVASRATESSAAVEAAEQHAQAVQLRAKGEHKALYPAIDLALQYGLISSAFTNFEQFFRPNSFQNQNVTFGLLIRFPFLSSVQRAHAQAADAEAVRARKDAEAAKDKVSLDSLRLQRAVQQAAAARDVSQLQYELAKADLDSAQARSQAGTATLHELQNASFQADDRSAALLDADFELVRSQLQLLHATGELEKWALAGR